jgi:hypothetical protein
MKERREKSIQFLDHEGIYGTSYEDIKRRVPDVSKAKRILNWEARISGNFITIATTRIIRIRLSDRW